MSKKVEAKINCSNCNAQFDFTLYRSIWGEYPENRELVMSDGINVAICPSCHIATKLQFPFLYTNAKQYFAVWWEPTYDIQIDKDREAYISMLGPGNYFAEAPRIQDWEEFKQTIIKYEKGILKGGPVKFSGEAHSLMQGFIQHIQSDNKKRNKGCLGSSIIGLLLLMVCLSSYFIPENDSVPENCSVVEIYETISPDYGVKVLTNFGTVEDAELILIPGTLDVGTYNVNVTRKADNFYSLDGTKYCIETNFCYEYVYFDEAILKIGSKYGYTKGTLFFE